MRWCFPTFFAAIPLLLPSVAAAQKVETDYAHGTDFAKYKTYKWVKIGENSDVNQLVEQRIVSALEEELAKKGLTKNDDNPDLLVGYQGAISHQTQLNTYGSTVGGGPGWGVGPRWGYGWGGNMGMASTMSTTTESKIRNGTLVVDMMDPQQKQLVFRGIATDTLNDKPEKNTKKLQNAVSKIFQKYPPKG
jgi:hypothetical protein